MHRRDSKPHGVPFAYYFPLVKKLKNKENQHENPKNPKNFNYLSLNQVAASLGNENFEIKIDKNYFKIKINSQKDIEKIVEYFQK